VIVAAFRLAKVHAVALASLAAGMVLAYTALVPGRLFVKADLAAWAELCAWGGILVVTAWVVSALRETLARAMADLEHAYRGVLEILSKFIQTVDTDTASHSVRVGLLAARIAQELGMERVAVEETRVAGLLHDVGKTEVSVGLLRKTASLSAEERAAVEKHVARGASMVGAVGDMLSHVADAVEAHHEKFDGSGYMGLKGEAIPRVARIIAAADAFDALTSDRPYRKAMSAFDARDSILAAAGTHFDPEVAEALKRIVDVDGENVLVAAPPERESTPTDRAAVSRN
jgi:putative nucleotidyltransferase with HDIG domain